MKMFTIGFTQKKAEQFFGALKDSDVRRVIDVRLNNSSQLAGFAKRDDLRYFLQEIGRIGYLHEPLLAPTRDILAAYRAKDIAWTEYEHQFFELLRERKIEQRLDPAMFDGGCLLCSEAAPHHCHRRLVVEYLQKHWGQIDVMHLCGAPMSS